MRGKSAVCGGSRGYRKIFKRRGVKRLGPIPTQTERDSNRGSATAHGHLNCDIHSDEDNSEAYNLKYEHVPGKVDQEQLKNEIMEDTSNN